MNLAGFEGVQQKEFWKTLRGNVSDYFKVNDLSPKCNPAMVVKTALMLTFYLAPVVILLIFQVNNWIALGLVLLAGIGKAGIGMSVMHDGLHGSYSSKKWVNRLTGASMYLIGSNVFNWKIQHNIYHHAYTNIHDMDEDIQTRWIIRLCEHTPLKPIHRFQHIYALFLYSLMSLSMLFGDITQLITYNKTGITRKHNASPLHELTRALLVKFVYLFVMLALPFLLTDYQWWQILGGFLFMHFVAGFILSIVFQMAHITEGAYQPINNNSVSTGNDWAIHQLLTTSSFGKNNRLLNWYVGGLNFQIEHHLFPNICHVHYKNLSTIVEQTAIEFGIPYNIKPSLRTALVSHMKRLKELGRN
ncbi:MAG: acyl-CoA desaturase [Bacteroidota bacterium]